MPTYSDLQEMLRDAPNSSAKLQLLGRSNGTSNPVFTGLVDISASDAGQIKFPATQNPSSNVNTLDDYEEGTWTPIDASGAGLTFTLVSPSTYTKIGREILLHFDVTYPITADGSNAAIGGMPFTCNASIYGTADMPYNQLGSYVGGLINVGSTNILLFTFAATAKTNLQMSTVRLIGDGSYRI